MDDGADLLPPEPKPARRMEVFGDSVSCGEVSEAVDYVGKEDRCTTDSIPTAGIPMPG